MKRVPSMVTIIDTFVNKAKSENKKCPVDASVLSCSICCIENNIDERWIRIFKNEFCKEYFFSIKAKLHGRSFYPISANIFAFTKYFPIEMTKVVILGQDPYHGNNQAVGLAFSVSRSSRIPPSLRNVYKELKSDIPGFKVPSHGDLTYWAQQGVLLLNDVLTVEQGIPGSHSNVGWQVFTNKILQYVNENCNNVVFILWGRHARSKSGLLSNSRHLVLESAHPSPFSATKFFDCKHFSKTNAYLQLHGKEPIDWQL